MVLNRTATITFLKQEQRVQKRKPFFFCPVFPLPEHFGFIMQTDTKSLKNLILDSSCQLGMRAVGEKKKKKRLCIFGIFICDCVAGLDLLGIPDTSLRGLNTRTARRVRKSKSEPTVERMLRRRRESAHRAINI